MTVDFIPKVIMTKFARFCHSCEKWFKRKIVQGLICPCCHLKLRDVPRNLTDITKRYLYFREYHARNKAHRNEMNREYYNKHKDKWKVYQQNCTITTQSVSNLQLHSAKEMPGVIQKQEKDAPIVPYG